MGFNTACRTQRGPQHCKAETPKPTTHKRVAAVSPCKSPPTPAAPTKTSTNVVLGKTSQPAHEKRKLSITLSSRVIVVGASTSQDRTQPAQKRPKIVSSRAPMRTYTNVVLGKTSRPVHEKRKLSTILPKRPSTWQDRPQPAQMRPKILSSLAPTRTSTNVVLGKTAQPAHEKRELSATLSKRPSTSQDGPQPAQKRPKVIKHRPNPKPTFSGVIVPKAKPTLISPLLSRRLGKQALLSVNIPKRPPLPPPLAPRG